LLVLIPSRAPHLLPAGFASGEGPREGARLRRVRVGPERSDGPTDPSRNLICVGRRMKILPVGRDALLVEVDSSHAAVSLATWARDRGLAAEVVPGARTVLLDRPRDADGLAASLEEWEPAETPPGPEVELTVTYDGPDLAFVADLWGCGISEVI